MARLPAGVHWASVAGLSLAVRVPLLRRSVEHILSRHYTRAQQQGLASVALPAWYRWLRAYYFAALKPLLPNDEFQKRYWEFGSLGDYQRYLATETDPRTQAFLTAVLGQLESRHRTTSQSVRLLEMGCGDGLTLRYVAERMPQSSVRSIVGIDISHPGLLLARHHAGSRAYLVQAAIGAIPFSQRYEVGCCRGVLMYLAPDAVVCALKETARICDTMVIAEPAIANGKSVAIDELEVSIKRIDLDQTSWIHPYRKLLTSLGGRVVRSDAIDGNCVLVVEWRHEGVLVP